jgi:hypothetical protein
MSDLGIAVGCAFIALCALVGMSGDYEDHKQMDAHYCDMVQMHKDSGGENGWPDYKGIYQNCP